jgi:fructose-1-phosphate kinase PfkB-like protein
VIVCLVANPSIDKLFEVDRLVRGDIHRPIGFEQTAGGKGLNVARAAGALGGDVRAVALFRGHTGKWLEETLSSEGVRGSYVWTHGENRSSLSVADRETGGLTEFYEHGSEVPSSAWPELAHATAAFFGDATWLTISGSLPAGIDDSAYRDLVADLQDRAPFPVDRRDCLGTLSLLHAFYRSDEVGTWVDVQKGQASVRLGRPNDAVSNLYRTPAPESAAVGA